MRRWWAVLVGGVMAVAACGGGGEDTSRPPDTSTSTAATTTTAPERVFDPRHPEAALVPVPGYRYVELPPAALAEARAQFERQPEAKTYLMGFAGRSLTRGSEGEAVVLALGIDPRAASVPGFRQAFLDGVKEDSVSAEDLTLADEPAAFAMDADGTIYVSWVKGSLGLLLTGEERAHLEEIATVLIEANRSLSFPDA